MSDRPRSLRDRLWQRPRARWRLGIPIGGILLFFGGAAALGAFDRGLALTSTNAFCYACHSHAAFVRPEYEASSHFRNASGVRADCADCHIPRGWFAKLRVKVVATADIVPELAGKIATREKFDAHRSEMAETVWRQYRADDSALCRNCHRPAAMDTAAQPPLAARLHARLDAGERTCIDCHRGLVHALPGD